MRVLSLFAGVGMFDYAWKKLGWETVAFAEMDKWCQRILDKHHPGVPIYDDVRDVTYERFKQDGIVSNAEGTRAGKNDIGVWQGIEGINGRQRTDWKGAPNQPTGIDIICGGFPCTDLSVAGKQAGMGEGTRSGLWSEFARIINEFKPRWVVVENVAALLSGDDGQWMGRVLRDLAEIGYDCEWHCIPAGNPNGLSAGAPHRRDRIWIVAHPASVDDSRNTGKIQRENELETTKRQEGRLCTSGNASGIRTRSEVAYPGILHVQGKERERTNQKDRKEQRERQIGSQGSRNRNAGSAKPGVGMLADGIAAGLSRSRWLPEPGIGRVATGVPDRVNKLKALGNGLVWQIPYEIGKAIIERDAA